MLDLNTQNSTRKCFDGKSVSAAIALIVIVMTGMVSWQHQIAFQAKASPDNLPPITLTVVALDGTQQVLHENDVGSLGPYRAFGGFVRSTGALGGLGNYTGVPISTFVSMTGGISNSYSIKIIAIDNFSKTLSCEALNGTGLVTYDNVTGQIVQHNQTLTPMLAYYYNDANLTSGGPLRLVIVGPEGLLTQSSLWVSNVVRLEVHPNLQPMNLTVVALNGTQLTLNETSISSLPAIRGVGASRNQLGIVKNLGNYTGPSLHTFCNLVGGTSNTTVLRLTAIDGYNQTISYDQVNGVFTTFDNVSGQPVQNNQSLTPLLAYHFNDAHLSSSDGPLKLAIIGPEGLATTSGYWVKQVVKLEIRYRDDVAVTAIAPSKSVVGQNSLCDLSVTVANQGGYDEVFVVTTYANQSVIGTQPIMLPAGNSTTIIFSWNTTGFALGNYTIRATAATVANEVDSADNSLTDGNVLVGIPGDVNGDGKVDLRDIGKIARHFGATPLSPSWDPMYDLNNDERINLADIGIAARHFGEHAR